jgi:hypothetical protein
LLKNASNRGVRGLTDAHGKSALPAGWVKRSSPVGAPEFFHAQSGAVVASAGEVVERHVAALALDGAGAGAPQQQMG